MDIIIILGGAVLLVASLLILAYIKRSRQKNKKSNGLRSPMGMSIVGSSGDGKEERKMATSDEIKLVDCSKETRQFSCGHEGPISFNYDIYGDHIETDKESLSQSEKCGDCIVAEMKKDIIQCCFCGQPIFPGSQVALYGGGKGIRKKWTTKHKGSAIGCMAWECCPSGGFFGGIWTGETVNSPFNVGLTAAEAVFVSGETVIGRVGDDGKMTKTRVNPKDVE